MAGVMRGLLGSRRFFLKAHDSPVLVHFDDAELAGGPLDGDLDSGHGDIGARVGVLLKHLGVVHLVDVIPGKDEDEFGSLAPDGIDVLVDRVGGALIPGLRDAHLRGNDFDVFAEAGERRPTGADVAAQAEGLVLREDKNASQARINAVGKRDVNDAVEGAKRNGGFGAVARKRPKAFPLAAGKKYGDGIPHGIGHGPAPRKA